LNTKKELKLTSDPNESLGLFMGFGFFVSNFNFTFGYIKKKQKDETRKII